MTKFKNQRAIRLHDEFANKPVLNEKEELSEIEKERLELQRLVKALPKDCPYVPLVVYFSDKDNEVVSKLSDIKTETGKMVRLCFQHKVEVRKINSPLHGTVFVFPKAFLDLVYLNREV